MSSGKREGVLSWEDYFMACAFLSGQRSKDPITQVGACIVNPRNRIVGMGYNGMPDGCPDEEMYWTKSEDWLRSKDPYVCHAELNAVLNSIQADLSDCKIYVSLFPCNGCTQIIIQSAIKEVIYYSDKNKSKPYFLASKKMLETAGVKYRQHKPKNSKILIDFEAIESTPGGPSTENEMGVEDSHAIDGPSTKNEMGVEDSHAIDGPSTENEMGVEDSHAMDGPSAKDQQ